MTISPPMSISQDGLKFIMRQENFSPVPIQDGGKMQIGYGHDIKPGELFTAVSEAAAQQILSADLIGPEKAINLRVNAPLQQYEFDALCSFIYNVGIGAFETSTLLALLNAGHKDLAACQFTRWCYETVDGVKKVSEGLLNRRHAEQDMFNGVSI